MRLRLAIVLSIGLASLFGCEQRVPDKELGKVVFEIPAVPGSDKPPPTPELDDIKDPSPTPPGKPQR
jgi:hypothetical protein